MKEFKPFDLVTSVAGHDQGSIYLLIKTEGKFVMLADGKKRKIDAPKIKNLKHIKYLREGRECETDEEIARLIKEIVKGG